MASNPFLDFDVLHLVIEEAAESQDKATLKQCSLVCRAFRAWSQCALFTSFKAYQPLCLNEMLGPHAHLATYIRILTIHWDNLHDSALPEVLPIMKNVRSLSIDIWEGNGESAALIASLQTHTFPSITHLTVRYCDDFPFFILTCPKLETLTLDAIRISSNSGEYVSDESQQHHPLHSLRSLTVDHYDTADFEPNTSLMRFLSRASSLESLIFGYTDGSYSFKVLQPLISRYNHLLKVLDVGSCFCPFFLLLCNFCILTVHAAYDVAGLQHLQLRELRFLQIFRCSMIETRDDDVLEISIDWLGKQLECLPPSHPLRRLVIKFSNPPNEFPESWAHLDEILHTKQCVHAIFTMEIDGRLDYLRNGISSALARSNQAGLLSFDLLECIRVVHTSLGRFVSENERSPRR